MKLLLRRIRSLILGPTIVPTTTERMGTYAGPEGLCLYFHDLGSGIELDLIETQRLINVLTASMVLRRGL